MRLWLIVRIGTGSLWVPNRLFKLCSCGRRMDMLDRHEDVKEEMIGKEIIGKVDR